jgi:hypothetical protein
MLQVAARDGVTLASAAGADKSKMARRSTKFSIKNHHVKNDFHLMEELVAFVP